MDMSIWYLVTEAKDWARSTAFSHSTINPCINIIWNRETKYKIIVHFKMILILPKN